jgi:beta-mannosidase
LEHTNSISLEGDDWRLGYKKLYDGSASGTIAESEKMTEWIRAVVPGNVRADMMEAERIPDLYIGMNNERAHWVNDCVWWYRKTFGKPRQQHRRFFLEFCGIDYMSQVYFNGRKLGENEGMFTRHLYDVSSIIRDENTLSVRVMGSSFLPKPSVKGLKKVWEKIGARLQGGEDVFPERLATLKCQMGFGWDFAPDIRTMGIWDEVKLIGCGNVFIGRVDVRPTVYHELDSAKIQIKLHLNSIVATSLDIAVRLRPLNFEGPTHNFSFNAFVKKGIETIERNVIVKEPALWYPWDKGNPNLYELTLSVYDKEKLSDSVSGIVGLRDIRMERNPGTPMRNLDWTFVVNGEREFIRGANWVPADSLMGRLRAEDYDDLIMMAKEANINMFRVWGGGLREKRYFYERCSREGILVWQEFPFACVFLGRLPTDEPFTRLAEKETSSIVKSIANYPCVALYCGGNEFSPRRNAKLLTRIARVVRSIDSSRVFLPASPARGDNHNWSIWHGFENIEAYRDDKCQFASEFGFQAAPAVDSLKQFLTKEGLWPAAEEWKFHNAELDKLQRYVGPIEQFSTLEDFVQASQKVQAFALQTAIEHYRRRKYECSGTILWQFNEPWPAISWSVVDYFRTPKLAYHKLKEIYHPVLVSLVHKLKPYTTGEEVPLEVWVINDFNYPVEQCMLDVHMESEGQKLFNLKFDLGTIPADSCRRYIEFSVKLPDRPDWLVCTTLRSGSDVISTNSYDLRVYDAGESTLKNRAYDRAAKLAMS